MTDRERIDAEDQRNILLEALRDLEGLTFENDDDEKCVRAIISSALTRAGLNP